MAIIRLIEGPVGVGKSTLASKTSKESNAPCLILDDWMATLFSPDRPSVGVLEWYVERKSRCIDQIWKLAYSILETRSDVVLELGLIQQSQRERFYDRVDFTNHSMKIYVLDAPRELRKKRVQQRNLMQGETYSMQVSDQVFDMANALWEPIDETECRDYTVEFITTG